MGELRAQLTDQAQTQTQRLAENVRRLSQELRELGENGKPDCTMADAARQIAAQESSWRARPSPPRRPIRRRARRPPAVCREPGEGSDHGPVLP
ncbi:hypothetical protein SSAG_00599 [Streptomyces sp. Mg1]|nr:hypothetical protein SSAG_00599 [Streptomyces sp. Mg1]